jgi:hypothetical protein
MYRCFSSFYEKTWRRWIATKTLQDPYTGTLFPFDKFLVLKLTNEASYVKSFVTTCTTNECTGYFINIPGSLGTLWSFDVGVRRFLQEIRHVCCTSR